MSKSHLIARFLLYCLTLKPDDPEYFFRLYATGKELEFLSYPVYRDKNGFLRKLPEKLYRTWIFEGWAETPEEVYERTKQYGVTREGAVLIHKEMRQIADLVCPMLAHPNEMGRAYLYAYAIDYVIRHKGDLPKPEIPLIIPCNYKDYNYMEGISEKVRAFDYP